MNIMFDDNIAMFVFITLIVFFFDEVESMISHDFLRSFASSHNIHVTTTFFFGVVHGSLKQFGSKALASTHPGYSQGTTKVNLSIVITTLIESIDVRIFNFFDKL